MIKHQNKGFRYAKAFVLIGFRKPPDERVVPYGFLPIRDPAAAEGGY